MSQLGHERRFKRKSRTSALPPIPDIIAGSHRLASYQSDPRRGKADRGERRQAAGAAAQGSCAFDFGARRSGGTPIFVSRRRPMLVVYQIRRSASAVARLAFEADALVDCVM